MHPLIPARGVERFHAHVRGGIIITMAHAANAVPEHTVPVAPQHLAVHVPVGQSIVVRAQVRVLMCRLDITQRAATAVITTVPDRVNVVDGRSIVQVVWKTRSAVDTIQLGVPATTAVPDRVNVPVEHGVPAASQTIAAV